MSTFADFILGPDYIIGWVVVGLAAGLLAGFAMKGGRFGMVGDVLAGLVGAALGGTLFGLFGRSAAGVGGSIAVALLAACALIVVLRTVARRPDL